MACKRRRRKTVERLIFFFFKYQNLFKMETQFAQHLMSSSLTVLESSHAWSPHHCRSREFPPSRRWATLDTCGDRNTDQSDNPSHALVVLTKTSAGTFYCPNVSLYNTMNESFKKMPFVFVLWVTELFPQILIFGNNIFHCGMFIPIKHKTICIQTGRSVAWTS